MHKTICRRGAFVGFDRQGGANDAQVVPLVMGLIEAGFADHLLFSGDAFRGYGRVITAFLPKLKASGRKRRGPAPDHRRQSAPLPRVRSEKEAQGAFITQAPGHTGHAGTVPARRGVAAREWSR